MSTLSLFINVLGPVLILVGIGLIAGPRLNIEAASISPLAYWILGPAFVFDLFQASGLESTTVIRLVAAGMAGMVAAAVVAAALTKATGQSPSVRAATILTSAYGNVGNAGLAITVFALGDDALAAAGVLMLTVNVAGITLGVGLAAGQQNGALGAARRGLLAPMTVAAMVAVAFNLVSIPVPLVAERSISLLAGALIPLMLITLGIQLAATGLQRPSIDIGITGIAKLIVAPLAAVGVASVVGLQGDLLGAVAIQSAMPPAVFCMLLAIENDLEPDRVTSSVVTTTALALITLPVVLALT